MSIDFFFFNDTATTEIYTLSLHDALPIFGRWQSGRARVRQRGRARRVRGAIEELVLGRDVALRIKRDRKSTRLNSSHSQISYAVFCLKKKNLCLSTSVSSQDLSISSTLTS